MKWNTKVISNLDRKNNIPIPIGILFFYICFMEKTIIPAGTSLLQEGNEFSPEIVEIVTPFADKNRLHVFDVLTTVVSSSLGKSPAYTEKFPIGTTQKETIHIAQADIELSVSVEQGVRRVQVRAMQLLDAL